MNDESRIVGIIRERQKAMRREMDRRGIAMKAVSQDSGVDYGTLLTYFPASRDKVPAQIPGSVIFALTGHIPADILSLLLPNGFLVVQVAEGVDYDEFSAACREFVDRKEKAHHPESEAGRDLGPGEKEELSAVVVRLRA
jgi:hypothetical protein